MVLPATYAAALVLMILGMLCQASWPATFKMAGKWRFELYYWDFAIGAAAAALLAALTLGSLGFDVPASGFGFSFVDDLMRAGKRHMMFAFAAGVVFNLANMLFLAAVSVTGMSVAFPVTLGTALMVGVVSSYVLAPAGIPGLLFTGVAVVLAAAVIAAMSYRTLALADSKTTIKAGKTRSVIPTASWKGVVVGAIGGLIMGGYRPLVGMASESETGMGPYAIVAVFTAGMFCSTFIFNLFLMNLPVAGQPIEILDYFKGTLKQHALGLAGGVVWAAGMIAFMVVSSADSKVSLGLRSGLEQGSIAVGAALGVLVWKEYGRAEDRVKLLLISMLGLAAAAAVLVGLGV
jgi:glucose uptake protein